MVKSQNTKKKRLVFLALWSGILAFYYLFVLITGRGIPCLFRMVSHYQCPGCGISRMFMAFAAGDWKAAYQYNSYIFVTLPYLMFITGKVLYGYVQEKQMFCGKIEKIFLCLYLAGLLIFGVLRNL